MQVDDFLAKLGETLDLSLVEDAKARGIEQVMKFRITLNFFF